VYVYRHIAHIQRSMGQYTGPYSRWGRSGRLIPRGQNQTDLPTCGSARTRDKECSLNALSSVSVSFCFVPGTEKQTHITQMSSRKEEEEEKKMTSCYKKWPRWKIGNKKRKKEKKSWGNLSDRYDICRVIHEARRIPVNGPGELYSDDAVLGMCMSFHWSG
jgi:hypothetical protein